MEVLFSEHHKIKAILLSEREIMTEIKKIGHQLINGLPHGRKRYLTQ